MKTKLLRLFRKHFTIQVEVKVPKPQRISLMNYKSPLSPQLPIPLYVVTNHKTHNIHEFDMVNEYEDMVMFCLGELLGYGDNYSEGKGKRLYYKNRQKREYNIQIRKTKLNGTYKII